MNELKVPEVASGSRVGYATSFSLSKSRDKLQEALIKHLRSKRKPRSGERSVAHGVSRGIRPNSYPRLTPWATYLVPGGGPICRGVPPWAPGLLTSRAIRAPTEGRPYKLGHYHLPKSNQ